MVSDTPNPTVSTLLGMVTLPAWIALRLAVG